MTNVLEKYQIYQAHQSLITNQFSGFIRNFDSFTPFTATSIPSMHEQLVAWFIQNQRRLPWRVAYDPYQVWVSEVMLQQTQVETALPYYERFVSELPNVHALAGADEQRVFSLWAGLGYYSRARNLMAAAKIVEHDYDGVVPDDYARLIALPGIGQYMAGAILS